MKKILFALSALCIFGACQDNEISQISIEDSPQFTAELPKELTTYLAAARVNSIDGLKTALNNTVLSGTGMMVQEIHPFASVEPATTVTTVDEQFESTLTARWVPGDINRNWNGDDNLDDIDWVSFTPFATANGIYDVEPIYRDMYTKWENDGYCTSVSIDEDIYDFSKGSPSLIIDTGLPSTGLPIADISVVGFLPASIFETVLGAENILGVAFSFVFVDENGDPVKSTRGKEDKAYTEIWFNDGFTWGDGDGFGIDLESVILHEFGHSLNLGHFGILQSFESEEEGTFENVYQPVNTMNAIYIGEARNFLGPNDKGNYCEAWGGWPWN